ncbi:MAG TPA: alpha/beta fold hydrolase [Nitriliruptorales bacterium]
MPVTAVSTDVELEYAWRHRGADANTEQPPVILDEPPILLIQGMSGTMRSWGEPFLTALARGADLLLFGNRGVGSSSRVTGPLSIADMATDTIGLLDALGLERVHVLGVSLGGMIAQQLTLDAPERVATLAIGCSSPGGPGCAVMSAETAARLFQDPSGVDDILRASWEVNLGQHFRDADASGRGFADFTEMVLDGPVSMVVIQVQAMAGAMHDVQDQLGLIEVPTLVIHGTDDQMLPDVNGRLIAERIPGARLETLDGVGHMWWWEQPGSAARLILDHVGVQHPAA